MSKTAFTPGPWEVKPCDGDFRKFDGDDYMIVSENVMVPALVWGGIIGSEEFRANARLIAASPAMYEALEAALHVMELQENRDDPVWDGRAPPASAIGKARAALAKADGRAREGGER